MDTTSGDTTEKLPIITGDGKAGSVESLASTAAQVRVDINQHAEDILAINARSEAGLRNRALTFAMVTFSWYMPTQIGYFVWRHEWLPIPDTMNLFLWAIITGPWLGFGMGNIVKILADKYGGKK